MRITFVLPVVNMNGGIKVAAIYAKALTVRGHEVILVSPPLKTIPFRRKIKSLISGKGWPADPPPLASHLDGTGLDIRLLDRWRPVTDDDVPDADVVIATWWETAEWVNALSPRKGAKVYFIQHHEVFSYLPVARCHASYRLPLHKIVIARWLKDLMQAQYGDAAVDLVPNSVDRTQFFSPVRDKQRVPTVGFLYSSVAFKGLDMSLEALQSVRKKFPDLRLICFGSEPRSATLPLPEGVEFSFSPPQDQIRNLYSQCDVWITASRSEGFNLPAMEAMACRTPVVATRTGWPEEAIETAKNGMLVDVDDVAGLARGVEWILSLANDEWKMLSQRAYETACAGSWEESSRMFEDALVHACRRSMRGEIAGTCALAL
jgi:glycosyltransferase involved in cell wall biosynthesis